MSFFTAVVGPIGLTRPAPLSLDRRFSVASSAGKVGVHRIIRMSSTATTRAELNDELRGVYGRVKDYLERNGAAVAIADLMMTVPNRRLRLLSKDELQEYGLDGTNAAQDDLDRLQLMRRCGDDFVMRRDAFMRSFDSECKAAGGDGRRPVTHRSTD